MFLFLPFYVSRVDTQCYLSFRCTRELFYFSIHYTMLTQSVATIYHHTALLQYHWLYSLCCPFYPRDLFISQLETCISSLFHPFCPFPPPLWQPLVCFLYSQVCFCFLFIHLCVCVCVCVCVLDFTYQFWLERTWIKGNNFYMILWPEDECQPPGSAYSAYTWVTSLVKGNAQEEKQP